MNCRPGCGACCIAPSISTPLPGQPAGKPAGVRCAQLTEDLRCAIFNQPERPSCCSGLKASEDMCGNTQAEALAYLSWLEMSTQPGEALLATGLGQPDIQTALIPQHTIRA